MILISLSVDRILLPTYVNWRGLSFNMEMAAAWLKHMNSVLSEFKKRQMLLVAGSRLCSRHSAWAGLFAKIAQPFTWSALVTVSARFPVFAIFRVKPFSYIRCLASNLNRRDCCWILFYDNNLIEQYGKNSWTLVYFLHTAEWKEFEMSTVKNSKTKFCAFYQKFVLAILGT